LLTPAGFNNPTTVDTGRGLRNGPLVVEVVFSPVSGDEASWVRCEVIEEVSCTDA